MSGGLRSFYLFLVLILIAVSASWVSQVNIRETSEGSGYSAPMVGGGHGDVFFNLSSAGFPFGYIVTKNDAAIFSRDSGRFSTEKRHAGFLVSGNLHKLNFLYNTVFYFSLSALFLLPFRWRKRKQIANSNEQS